MNKMIKKILFILLNTVVILGSIGIIAFVLGA